MTDSNFTFLDEALLDSYIWGDEGAILEGEYTRLVTQATWFREQGAHWRAAPGAPTVVEIVSHLAAELLPNGPAPSLSDALHALDRVYGTWQVETAAFQRSQARRLAFSSGLLAILRAIRDAGDFQGDRSGAG